VPPPISAEPEDARQVDAFSEQRAPEPPPPPPRHPLRRPAAERRPVGDVSLRDFRNAVSEADEFGAGSARAEKAGREAYAAAPAAPSSLDLDRPPRGYDRAQERAEPRMFEQTSQERMLEQRDTSPHDELSEPLPESSVALDDTRPPPAKARRAQPPPVRGEDEYAHPGERVRPPRSYAGLIKGIIAAATVAVLGGLLFWQKSNLIAAYHAWRPPASQVAREAPSQPATKKIQERVEPGGQQTPAAAGATAPAQLAAVAQKVVLYEEDPADPNGKRFVGSAIWHTETVTPGPGQSPELAIRADVEVPERKLAMTWSLRRNTDKSLPASHTVEIIFKLPPDFPAGGITNVPGILMKPAETTKGAPLRGLAVKVTSGYFLIGLSNSETDKEYNLQMLKERSWFDIPVVYDNNRRAILAVEKGTPGEQVFAEAFRVWKQ
jgi:hypothetical protein